MSVAVNFKTSKHLKESLNHISEVRHKTITDIINGLLENYVRDEYKSWISDRELARKARDISNYELG
jgi:predicted transcriptional regulator